MSKFKKVIKPDQKLTNFFSRRENGPTPSSSQSGPSSSQLRQTTMPSKSQQNSKPTQSQSVNNNKLPPRPDQEVISVSSGSHKSHISISSDNSPSVIVVTSSPPKRPRTRTIVDVVEIMSPPRRSSRIQHFPPAITSEINNSRSPSIQYLGSSQHPTPKLAPPPKPLKRKKKFESDSDISPSNSIIMVRPRAMTSSTAPISPRRSAMKPAPIVHSLLTPKETTSSPCKSSGKHSRRKAHFARPKEGVDLVPSSQSDEQELAVLMPIKKDREDIEVTVNKWRQETTPPVPPLIVHGDWDMDIDTDIQPVPDTDMEYPSDVDPGNLIPDLAVDSSPYLSSEAEVKASLLQKSSANTSVDKASLPFASTSTRPITPSPLLDNGAAPPTTPVALNAVTKTEQIIAQIKEKALAASLSSPEEPLLTYQPLEESSDEDESDGLDMLAFKQVKNIAIPKTKSGHGFNSRESSPTRPGRYALRDRTLSSSPLSSPSSHASPPSNHRISTRTRVFTNPLPKHHNNSSSKRKKPSNNPLDFLLKEKKLADKKGNGIDALRLAEESIDIKMEDGDEATGVEDERYKVKFEMGKLTNEEAAWKAVEESARHKSSTPGDSADGLGDDHEAVVLGEDEAKLLGLKDGERMKKILESDRAGKVKIKVEKVLGVRLWDDNPRPADYFMTAKLKFPLVCDRQPVLQLLESAWRRQVDIAVLADSGVLTTIEPHNYVPLVPFLCDAALSGHDLISGGFAFTVLSHLWSRQFPETGNLGFCISSALIRLGASPAIFETIGFTTAGASNEFIDEDGRAAAIYRLVMLSKLASYSGALPNEDVPVTIVSLLLLAMDPSTSAELKRDILITINTVCQSIKGDTDTASIIELETCRKAFKFATKLTPINQIQLISMFSSGCGQTQRIARWLAYGLLVGEYAISEEIYSNLPPLANLIQLLSAQGSGGSFDIQTNADAIDYDDLGYKIDILSVALSGIDGYVAEERLIEAIATREGKYSKEKPPTQLELVRAAIDEIHGKIVDTRAAHLDRSRAKAALQRLSMRIYYQRLAASKSGSKRKIREYFAPPAS